jgi:hypothetical protein
MPPKTELARIADVRRRDIKSHPLLSPMTRSSSDDRAIRNAQRPARKYHAHPDAYNEAEREPDCDAEQRPTSIQEQSVA